MTRSDLADLAEVDELEILVIVDNEVDPLSTSQNVGLKQDGLMKLAQLASDDARGGAKGELRMDSACCGGHGLSLLIIATKEGKKHRLLFDTGPEEDLWERNATRLKLDLGSIDYIHLSHWHRDHSGGMLNAVRMISQAKQPGEKVIVDLHPDRPDHRGFSPLPGVNISLEADPSFEEVEKAGAQVVKSNELHSVLDGAFLISGAIPRKTEYEKGMRGGVRFAASTGTWAPDTAIMDERFVMCNLKGRGLVLFTGCSHAGVVNASRHSLELGGGAPLHAVVGGFHLAGAEVEKMESSVRDLKTLGPKIMMPGHCTGWAFKFMIEKEMPGSLVPSFVGVKYSFT